LIGVIIYELFFGLLLDIIEIFDMIMHEFGRFYSLQVY
jgi:hypothetical protein